MKNLAKTTVGSKTAKGQRVSKKLRNTHSKQIEKTLQTSEKSRNTNRPQQRVNLNQNEAFSTSNEVRTQQMGSEYEKERQKKKSSKQVPHRKAAAVVEK